MLGLTFREGWELSQIDVSNAFLHSEQDEVFSQQQHQTFTISVTNSRTQNIELMRKSKVKFIIILIKEQMCT